MSSFHRCALADLGSPGMREKKTVKYGSSAVALSGFVSEPCRRRAVPRDRERCGEGRSQQSAPKQGISGSSPPSCYTLILHLQYSTASPSSSSPKTPVGPTTPCSP